MSAGFGDIVKYSIDHLSSEIETNTEFKILSNFGKYEEDLLVSFSKPLIHSLNKEDHVQQLYNTEYPSPHESAIILGDIINDASMLSLTPI